MNTPAQCGVIKPPKTDIYSEAPQLTQAMLMLAGGTADDKDAPTPKRSANAPKACNPT